MEEELLTKQDVVKLLKVKPRTVDYLTATRQIPFVRGVGREYKFLKSSIIAWLKKKETKPEDYFVEI